LSLIYIRCHEITFPLRDNYVTYFPGIVNDLFTIPGKYVTYHVRHRFLEANETELPSL